MNYTRLKELSISVTDGVHNTVIDDKNGNSYLLSCKNIKNNKISYDENDRKINLDTLIKLRNRTKLEKNDILLTTVGTIGETAIIKDNNPNYEFQRSVGIIKIDSSRINPYYVYYYLQSNYAKSLIASKIKGAVQKCLFLEDIRMLEIPTVSDELQQHIVDTIGSIDDLIEKYEYINNNLFKLGSSIIKESYLNGFNKFRLGDCLSLLKDGTHNPPKRIKNGIPLLTGQNIENGFINHNDITYISKEDYNKIHSKYEPISGDLVITKIGTVGKVAVLRSCDIPIAIHCNSALLRFKDLSSAIAYFILTSIDFQNEFHSHKKQTVQEFINLEQLSNLEIKIPTVLDSKHDIIYKEISKNKDIIELLEMQKEIYLKKFFG